MELDYIREFITLERIRSFTRAADELFTTEATLSRHIKALERQLGQPLFSRSTRSVELTEFGAGFLPYALRMAQVMTECESYLLNGGPASSSRLIIGIFGPIKYYEAFHEALSRFSARNPQCAVVTIQGDIHQLKDKLCRNEYNLSIVREESGCADDGFGRMNVLREPLCVVLPKSDPLSELESIDISLLEGRNISLPSEHMLSHRLFLNACRLHGFRPTVTSILRPQEFMETFSIGDTPTILCQNMASRFVNQETQVVREVRPALNEYVNILYPKSSRLPELTREAIQCFEEVSASPMAR